MGKTHKKHFKKLQEFLLIYIVYTIFCQTFQNEEYISVDVKNIFLMVVYQFLLLSFVMLLAWLLLKLFFKHNPKLHVTGLFGCTHKSMAMGILLINAIFEGNDSIGLYTLPILIWHPMQIFIGSALAPRLATYVEMKLQEVSNFEGENKEDIEANSSGDETSSCE